MNEDMDKTSVNPEDAIPDELTLLKERADIMGIKYHPSIGVDSLKAKINTALADPPVKDIPVSKTESAKIAPPVLSQEALTQQYHTKLRKEAHKLIRVRITCMNPNKKDFPGEIFSVSNAIIGTVKKFIPYNAEAGYHIPYVLYENLKERQFQHFSTVELPGGKVKIETKLVKEFAIEILEPLTKEELAELATRQALNHSVD